MAEIPQYGRLLNGRYQLVRLLKKGEMGEVYTAKDSLIRDFVIIKKTRAEEARILSGLCHDGIVSYLDSFKEADACKGKSSKSGAEDAPGDFSAENRRSVFLVEEYVPGETLSSYVRRNGPMKEDQVIEIGLQLCGILSYLHGLRPPLIYRDLKPDNIMLQPDGKVKLIDFGIAREYVKWEDCDTNHFGTRGYAAPEQYGGCLSQSDARSDLFGLGMVLYYLLTGEDAKPPATPARSGSCLMNRGLLKDAVSPAFHRLLLKCTEAEPLKRYQSAEVLAYELRQVKEASGSFVPAGQKVRPDASSQITEEHKNKQALNRVLLAILVIFGCAFGILLEFFFLLWLSI